MPRTVRRSGQYAANAIMRQMRRLLTVLLAAILLLPLLPAAPAGAAETPLRIAFIDSGISTRHVAEERVEPGKNYVFPEADTRDRIGHGTATAGLVLGSEDQGVSGVCPEITAVPLVVVDTYPTGGVKNGGPEALCQAMRDAVDLFDCRIINISLCTEEDSPELRSAAAYAEEHGAVVVAAVGNEGTEGPAFYPAAYDSVIAVGSSEGDHAAAFSQPGADLLAEGADLLAPTNKNRIQPAPVSGTSYSCAIVSGICARLLLCYPDLSPAELREALYAMAEDLLEPGFDAVSGWGRIPTDPAIPTPYLDVLETGWSREGILYVTERGIMTGTGTGRFSPEGILNRAMFVTILYRMAGEPKTAQSSVFPDADGEAYYAPALAWAANGGLVQGYEDGSFGPEAPVTREQMTTLLWRLQGRPAGSGELSSFGDADAVSDWARDALAWAVGTGILSGKGDGNLDPRGIATREEAAQLMRNFLERFGPSV